ncbi:hypothetical protein QCA50_007402 [Cerrena zonata]|uniref:GST C-terminal domain-containing protein n=1 Tax=Cerrena zonata TaxID=2478898 RepID=A0AAW0GD67_9APHY
MPALMTPISDSVSNPSFNVRAYNAHARRAFSELQSALANNEWLVGGKCTIADLAFIVWNHSITRAIVSLEEISAEFPAVSSWVSRLRARESARRVMQLSHVE